MIAKKSVGASSDVQLRIKSLPAGTHRHAIAYEAMRKLSKHSALSFCPGLSEFVDVAKCHAEAEQCPAKYHGGGKYLTGKSTTFADMDACRVLGRLGTFVEVFFSKSSLYNSPHLSFNDGTKLVSKAPTYDDIDSTWDMACRDMYKYMYKYKNERCIGHTCNYKGCLRLKGCCDYWRSFSFPERLGCRIRIYR